jgi:hypothetical protein
MFLARVSRLSSTEKPFEKQQFSKTVFKVILPVDSLICSQSSRA